MNFRLFGVLAVPAAIFALVLSAQSPMAAEPAPEAVIQLKPYLGGQWSFTARVRDRDETFLLDTGGGLSVITPATAAEAGCTPWDRITGYRMRGDRVDLQRCDGVRFAVDALTLSPPSVGVWDMSKLLPKDAPPLAGSLALDAFAGRVITLDLAGRRLILESPASLAARIRRAHEVPVRFAREAGGLALVPLVPLETSAGRVWAELDSGSDAPLMVARHIAALLSLDPEKKGGQPVSARLAGGVPLTTTAYIGDFIIDGDIGSPVMKDWAITIDMARQRLWIAAAEDDAPKTAPAPAH